MKKTALPIVLIVLLTAAGADGQEEASEQVQEPSQEAPATAPTDAVDTTSYGIGLQMGRNFRFQEFEPNLELMLRGIRDGLSGSTPLFSQAEIQASAQVTQAAAIRAITARNRALGEAFLTANARKEGVVTLESGLQYEVLETGDGPTPSLQDRVTVHYRSALIDGTVLDDTHAKGEPETMAIEGLIPAWVEALQRMRVGSKWRLFVPPELGHGGRGSGQIGPGATAVFEVELVGIADPEAASDPAAREQQAGDEGVSGDDG